MSLTSEQRSQVDNWIYCSGADERSPNQKKI